MNTSEQIRFDGGVDACAAPHLLAPNQVQTSTNVDFSLEWGGLVCRRGHIVFGTGANFKLIDRNYTATTIDESPWYGIGASGGLYRGTGTTGTRTLTVVGTNGDQVSTKSGLTKYQQKVYAAIGNAGYRDNGTNCWNWIIDKPATPFGTVATSGYGTFTAFNGTLTAVEGTVVSAAGSPWLLNTCTTGTGTRIVLTGTLGTSAYNWEDPVVIVTDTTSSLAPAGTQTYTKGPYAVDYMMFAFSNPSVVVRVTRDASIGDTSFANYWHAETTLDEIRSALPNPTALALAQQGEISATESLVALNSFTNAVGGGGKLRPNSPIGYIAPITTGSMPWAVPRTDYQFVGATPNPGWTDIRAVRVIVEAIDTTAAYIGGWSSIGSQLVPLTDLFGGIRYWQTFARVENGVIVEEGAPSDASNPIYPQFGAGALSLTVYTGTATSGVTHRVIYRAGGLLDDAYQVGMIPLPGTLAYDYGNPDLNVINNPRMVRNIESTWPSDGFGAVSEPFADRIFLGTGNSIIWTAPGSPTQLQSDTETTVSNSGDVVKGLIVWDRLIIVNQNSVYEFDGNTFEGPDADWVLKKSGARRGSIAPRTIIKTPYGIPLLNYDGISMYTPGYGVDQPIDWVWDKIGDAWRGTGTNAPATLKGSRVPAINMSQIRDATAAYGDGKLYLLLPTQGLSTAKTLFVIDFTHKNVWWYQTSESSEYYGMFYDIVENRLIVGGGPGLYQFETGLTDNGNKIVWTAKTRAWTTKNDMVLENLSVEGICNVGTATGSLGGIVVTAIIDNTSTQTLGTLTNTTKQWVPLTLNGTVGNNVVFGFSGTNLGTAQSNVYGLSWDTIVQPPKVNYWRSEEDLSGGEQQKIWDVHFDEIDILGTGTITAVTFIDNIATLTNTMTGLTGGRTLVPTAFPAETYGYIAYTTYTGTPLFKIYKTYNITRPEPAPVVSYVTDRFIPGDGGNGNATMEAWWHDVLSDLNCNGGTTTATHYIDNLVVSTNTYTGNGRTGYTKPFIVQTYGNVAYTKYSSTTPFKHYVTYYKYDLEPTRTTSWEGSFSVLPSENFVKTWLPTINPQGGTVAALLYDESNAIIGSASLTGSIRKTYEIGLANITKGKTIKPIYTSSTPFKHYVTNYEFAPKPFGKQTWVVNYFRPQGASQLGMGRFHTIDLEGTATSTVTSTWLVDETAILTNTWTISSGRNVIDQIPFPSGVRGYLFQQQLTSTNNFNVWRSNIDFENITVKGLVRNVIKGTPVEVVA